MSEFDYLIKNNIRNHDGIKKLCSPLFENFGFNGLFYHYISNDGFGTSFSSHIESFEYYFYNHNYLCNPCIRHPDFFQSGTLFIADVKNKTYQELIQEESNLFFLDYKIVIFEKIKEGCQGFSFSVHKKDNFINPSYILNHIPTLKSFVRYFNENGATLLKSIQSNQLSIEKYYGEEFYKEPSFMPSQNDRLKKIEFLKQIGVLDPVDNIDLSPREIECVRMMLLGYSASEIGTLLKLSKRTVEFYLENIKLKANCFSKLELFEKFREIDSLNLL